MNKIILRLLLVVVVYKSCTTLPASNNESPSITNLPNTMSNISIVEIPVADLSRAIKFYSSILDVTIEEATMGNITMGIIPSVEGDVSIVLAKGDDYKPTMDGTIVYLNGGNDLQHILNKVEANHGSILVPKTVITPEMGFFALFTDTEGNTLGLHSAK